MRRSLMPRVSIRLAGGCCGAMVALSMACAEREVPPPPVETAPAAAPAVAESVPDTLVGDSVMARDTLPLPAP
jgi:hypothetical protein